MEKTILIVVFNMVSFVGNCSITCDKFGGSMNYKSIFFIASFCNVAGLYAEDGRLGSDFRFPQPVVNAKSGMVERHSLMSYHLKNRDKDCLSDDALDAYLTSFQEKDEFDTSSEQELSNADSLDTQKTVYHQEQSLWQRLLAFLRWMHQAK